MSNVNYKLTNSKEKFFLQKKKSRPGPACWSPLLNTETVDTTTTGKYEWIDAV